MDGIAPVRKVSLICLAASVALAAGIQAAPAGAAGTVCVKPNTTIPVAGKNFVDGRDYPLSIAPHIPDKENRGSILSAVEDQSTWAPRGSVQSTNGSWSTMLLIPPTTTLRNLPIILHTILAFGGGSGIVDPLQVQVDVRSAYANPSFAPTVTPTVRRNYFIPVQHYGFKAAASVYAHVLRPNGTKLRTSKLLGSRLTSAFPCGTHRPGNTGLVNFTGATVGRNWTIAVNTSRTNPRAAGTVKLKTRVTR